MARTTEEVLAHHLSSFGAGNLEEVLADYGAESLMITQQGTMKGPGEMKPMFEGLIAEFSKPGASFTLQTQAVEGDVAFLVWNAETADNVYEVAADTMVIRDGMIAVQTFAGKITPKG